MTFIKICTCLEYPITLGYKIYVREAFWTTWTMLDEKLQFN